MSKIYVFVIIIVLSTSCGIVKNNFWAPRGFTYKYTGEYNGIDSLINIDGYFVATEPLKTLSRGKPYDSYSSFALYNNALAYNNMSGYWGVYDIRGDTIDIQYIADSYVVQGATSYATKYLIISKNELEVLEKSGIKNITKTEYFSNHILQRSDSSRIIPNSSDCPWLKKKWFWKKRAKKSSIEE